MLQPESPGLDLGRVVEEAADISPAVRDQAADLVEGYVREQALSALDSVLAAAEREARADPNAVRTAHYASRLVDAEVARFRALARDFG